MKNINIEKFLSTVFFISFITLIFIGVNISNGTFSAESFEEIKWINPILQIVALVSGLGYIVYTRFLRK